MKNMLMKFESAELGVSFGGMLYQGKPVMDAVELARSLGYANPHEALKDNCKSLIKLNSSQTLELGLSFRPKGIILAQESDAYRLILRSRLQKAERVQDWICEEVLPTIRETGKYKARRAEHDIEISDALLSVARVVAEATASATVRAVIDIARREGDGKSYKEVECHQGNEQRLAVDEFVSVGTISLEVGMTGSACRRLITFAGIRTKTYKHTQGVLVHREEFLAALGQLIHDSVPPTRGHRRWHHPDFGGFNFGGTDTPISSGEKQD
ncbi:DNA-binding protein [Salmonella enterica]|nr:DNA-binding protein [Salmonella enterica]